MKRFLLTCVTLWIAWGAYAQERTISGRVTSAEDGSALPGVNVVVKGSVSGTVTDADGKFTMSIPGSDAVLVFSFIGLQTKDVSVGERSVVDVQLNTDVTQLSEVVVTAVGIEADKKALGYSLQTVKSEDVVSSRETNFVSALASKVPGVQVTSSSGSPGASANIRIRGSKSITNGNNPLFVIDGVPLDNSEAGNGVGGVDQSNRLVDLNPNDIESITILKGPSATALYGLRATNGAVIVTTKTGRSGKQVVTVNSSLMVNEINKVADLQSTYTQGRPRNYAGYPQTANGTYQGPETLENYSWGPKFSDLEFGDDEDDRDGFPGYAFDKNGVLVLKGQGNGTPAKPYDQYDFFQKGITSDNNISVAGGTDKLNYYLSTGYLTQTGVVPLSNFKRKAVKVNLNAKLSDKFNLGISANYVNSGGYRVQRGSNISGVMLGLLRSSPSFDNGNGKSGKDAANDPDTYTLPDGTQRSYRNGVYDSPYWTAAKNPFKDDVNRIYGNINFSYQLTDWAKLSYKLGVDTYTDSRNQALDVYSASQPSGQINNSTEYSTDWNSDLLLLLSPQLGKDFDFTATLGHNFFSQESFTNTQTGTGFGQPGFFNIANASTIQAAQFWNRKRKIAGLFGDVKLGYKETVYINLSGRNDWSSTLSKNNNSFFYPAASVGFIFSELLNIENNPVFSYGKLRASWGKVGNDAPIFATYNLYPSYAVGGDGFITNLTTPLLDLPAYERSGARGNPNLKPEFTTTTEIGGEFKFAGGRLNLDVTYYKSLTSDAIINVAVPATTGYNSELRNSAKIENKGWEIALGGTIVNAGDFNWSVDVNFNAYKNVVKELAPGVDRVAMAGFTSTSSNAIAGQPFGIIFGSHFARDEQGRMLIGDDGWPLVASTDGPIGNPNPDWTSGIRNTFSWKGLSLTALIDIRQGGQIWQGTQGIMNYFGTSQESADLREVKGHVFEGIRKSDGQPNTTPVDYFPSPDPITGLFPSNNNATNSIYWVRYAFGGLSEQSVYDASWVRLREVTITYMFPKTLFENKFIKSATLSLTGRNLWLKTDAPGIDPETNLTGASNGFGLEYFNMPNTRSYGAVVQLTF